MTERRLLVTGGSGFIGTNLVESVVRRGDVEVLNIDLKRPRGIGAHYRQLDILDSVALRSVVAEFQPTHVVHLAARTDLDGRSLDDYAANTHGTQNLLEALRNAPGLQRMVLASSRMVCNIGYEPKDDTDFLPPNPYGASKVEMEKIIRRNDPSAPWTIVRPTSIWGPWFSVPYADFFKHVLAGRYVHPAGVRVLKHFGYVENAVHQIEQILAASEDDVVGRVLYLSDYDPIEVLSFARELAEAASAPSVREVPNFALATLAKCGDMIKATGLMRNPPLTTFRLNNLRTNMTFDLHRTRRVAPELPVERHDGILRTLEWMRLRGTVRQDERV